MSEYPSGSEEAGPASAVAELFGSTRVKLVLAILAVEVLVFLVGLFTPVTPSVRQLLLNETNTEFAPFQGAGPVELVTLIFSHNLLIALAEMIPGAGAVLFMTSVYSTGVAFQVLVTSKGLPALWGVVLFAYPFSLVELSAYAVAVGSGIMLLLAWRRKGLRQEIRVFALEGMTVALILLAAAAMEAATTLSPLLGLGLWLPTAVVLALLIALVRVRRI